MFHSIGVIGKQNTSGVTETLEALIHFLQKKSITVFLEHNTAQLIKAKLPLKIIAYDKIGAQCDLAIVVGGDGSLLSAARQLGAQPIPLIGINRGTFGFLTDIRPDEFEQKLETILNGNYIEEKRFMLEACSMKDLQPQSPSYTAINEIVLTLDQPTRMISFEIYIDNVFMYSQRSDGLIIATPTGSTAYSLSAGGAIVHPHLDAVTLIPMFPHSLSNRPIVIDANGLITLRIPETSEGFPRIICDGQTAFGVHAGEEIQIRKSSKILHLLHPMDYDYFTALRSKLHWGKQLTTVDMP